MGRIVKVIPSQEDLEIRSCLVKTKNSQGVYPANKLRYLEGYAEDIPLPKNEVPSNQPDVLVRNQLPQDAKTKARQRLGKLNLYFLGLFLSTRSKENWQNHWDGTLG